MKRKASADFISKILAYNLYVCIDLYRCIYIYPVRVDLFPFMEYKRNKFGKKKWNESIELNGL